MSRATILAGVLTLSASLLAPLTASAQAKPDAARGRTVWAVIVGIERYNDAAIPACHRTIAEGEAIANWLTETARWDRRNILRLNDQGAAKHGKPNEPVANLLPTRENLRWALGEWLGSRVQRGDVVLLSFAGQAAATASGVTLLPIDAQARELAKTGWSPEDAIDDLARIRGCSVVCWLDTSPNGRGKPVAPPAAAPIAAQFLDRLARWPGVTVWLAATSKIASEGTDRSPFAAALQAGLGTRPDTLLACLNAMYQNTDLASQGFRVRGGLPADLSLWPPYLLPPRGLRPELVVQHGHADAVTLIATTADGERTITAGRDSTIRVWRTKDRTLLAVLPGHTIGVTALELASGGRFLVSGDGAGQVRLWDLDERRAKPLDGPPPHAARIVKVGFLRDGARFVSLDQDGHCVLWDARGPLLKPTVLMKANAVQIATASNGDPIALALAERTGTIHLLDADGKPKRDLPSPGERPTALDLAPNGKRLAAGDGEGHVRIWNLETGAVESRRDREGKVTALRLGPGRRLAIGTEEGLYLADLAQGSRKLDGMSGTVDAARFSADGRWLGALSGESDVALWDLSAQGAAAVPLVAAGAEPAYTALAFALDGRSLTAGESDGGIRSWSLPERRERPRIPPHRGKVDVLDISLNGRYLLQINHEGTALVWDFEEGRGAQALDGRWVAGAFLPDATGLVLTRDPNDGGDVVLVERATGNIIRKYTRPWAESGGKSQADFGRVAVSHDGRRVAAAAAPGSGEFVCVWPTSGSEPLRRGTTGPRTFRGHKRSVSAVDLSANGSLVLTASEDGTAHVWDVSGDGKTPVVTLSAPAGHEITFARFNPVNAQQVITAAWSPGRAARVDLWDWKAGEAPRPRPLGELEGRVHALTFTPDGRWVAAAGQDRLLRAWALGEARPRPLMIEPDHPENHHAEQVNALASLPGPPMIVSAGDDATVRFWGLDAKTSRGTLLGTLTAAATTEPVEAGRPAAAASGVEWIAYTPDGIFDGSLEGDRMVRFSLGSEVRNLDQYERRFYKFKLTDDLRRGFRPKAPEPATPPLLVLESEDIEHDERVRDIELRIALSDPAAGTAGLRLYQNGVPVLDGEDFQPIGNTGRVSAKVRLRNGPNTFYAMAERSGDVDSRSPDIEIFCRGPETPSRLHILSLGVSHYTRNSLQYADKDAIAMADFLNQQAARGPVPTGVKFTLKNTDVNQKTVDDAFTRLRAAVRGRPEDTVVVFLAGHTSILKDQTGRERFSLLLPKYPFEADTPLLTASRGVRAVTDGSPKFVGTDLPFYVLYRNLAHLDALQRLVIVDACQAEAIFNDPGVKLIQEVMETGARRVRTSYLLAARRGEAATEAEALEHGLLTYVLLRGMKAPGLKTVSPRVAVLEEIPSADRNGDGLVTTRELRSYAERTLPQLASVYPQMAQRSGDPTPAQPSPPPAPQALRMQTAETSFPLVELTPDR